MTLYSWSLNKVRCIYGVCGVMCDRRALVLFQLVCMGLLRLPRARPVVLTFLATLLTLVAVLIDVYLYRLRMWNDDAWDCSSTHSCVGAEYGFYGRWKAAPVIALVGLILQALGNILIIGLHEARFDDHKQRDIPSKELHTTTADPNDDKEGCGALTQMSASHVVY